MAVTATASAIALVAAILAPTQQPAPKMSVPGVQLAQGQTCHYVYDCPVGETCHKSKYDYINGICVKD